MTTLGLARGNVELRQFFRQKEAVVFTFTLPAVLMVLLGSIFGGKVGDSGISTGTVFAAGMIGAGIVSTSFVNMGNSITADRADGTLKRLRGTPLPATSYFGGKIILVAAASVAEVILLLIVAGLLFDLHLPSTAGRWLTFLWVFVLGITSCGMIGIAASALARSIAGAAAIMNLVFVAFQFISGVFVTPITQLPHVMVVIASFFPVKWICQGLRSVFLPDSMAAYEMAGQWELGKVALVLGAWTVAGLVLCLLTFRWSNTR